MAIRRKKHLAGGSLAVAGAVLLAAPPPPSPPRRSTCPTPRGVLLRGQRPDRQTDTGRHRQHRLPEPPQPALSAVNFTTSDIEVYYHHDCFPGLPGKPGDWHFGLGSLHWANFTYPALSYKTVH
ncbi:hypothetical protein [Streptomyces eurocidicus]|uniref:hypothetical protein n=1 Tax=Streptomyces eurocidicus TaxID=66423 RepID=UPI001FD584AC|nr:hypothetical protein [Streptomyces eurocidicus]